MPKVGDQQDEQDGLPNPDIVRRAEDEGFVEGEEEVEVRKLREHDGGTLRDDVGLRYSVSECEVFVLSEMGEEGTDEGGNRLDGEEEDSVKERDLSAGRGVLYC